jgi:hypothetical protein
LLGGVYEELIVRLEKDCKDKEAEIAKKQAVLNRLNGHLAVINGRLADKWIDVIDGDKDDSPAVPFRLLGRFPMKRGKPCEYTLLCQHATYSF